MMDFDRDFERYLAAWYVKIAKESDEEVEAEALFDFAPNLYEEWANAANEQLNGESPRSFFAKIDKPERLLELFINNPCALLYDRIKEVPACVEGLIKLIESDNCADTKTDAVQLLNEMGIKPPVASYCRIIADQNAPAQLADLCVELLAEYADEAAGILYGLTDSASELAKARVAEVLLHAKPDERTYMLLTDLFQTGNHTAQYASYLGKYGDPRAAELLYERLKSAERNDYIELRNAIEALGGVVDD